MASGKKHENIGITGWNDPRSYIKRTDANGQTTYKGTFVLNGAEFRFSLNQQTTGKYLMRDRVSAISPEDGFVLQVVGGEKKRRLNRQMAPLSDQETDPQESNTDAPVQSKRANRLKELNVTTEVYGQSLAEETVKINVEQAVHRLYTKHADLIHRRLKTSSRPDTIIPCVAAALYAEDYIAINHRSTADSTKKAYAKAIKDNYVLMPAIPMAKVTTKKMKQYLDSHPVGSNTLRLLNGFWAFCLAKGICIGVNPFPDTKKRKLSVTTKQARALVPDELSIRQQDILFTKLMSEEVSGDSCGIALMLWGGFSAKDACAFNWEDIIFNQGQPDFVRVRYYQNDKAGATHDYTRPLFPQAARILLRRYSELTIKYTPETLFKCPIVSTKQSYKKAMTASALTQYGAMLLRTIGVSEETLMKLKMPKVAVSSRIFYNTYVKNLIQRCGFANDPGTVNFMLGQSLSGSVTDDHYSSFVSELATERIFTALKAAGPLEDIEEPETPIIYKDGQEQYTITPENTRQWIGVVADITLQPGEELEIVCPHGISG
ncbi:hypothetical protein AALB19_16515, partial [Oscillospiraceae bacterium 50-58]